MVRYLTGTIRFDDRDQRRRFKVCAKKLGLPLNRFMLLACETLAREVEKGVYHGVSREVRLLRVPESIVDNAVVEGV